MNQTIVNVYFIMLNQDIKLLKLIEYKGTLCWNDNKCLISSSFFLETDYRKFLTKYWNYERDKT